MENITMENIFNAFCEQKAFNKEIENFASAASDRIADICKWANTSDACINNLTEGLKHTNASIALVTGLAIGGWIVNAIRIRKLETKAKNLEDRLDNVELNLYNEKTKADTTEE